MLGCQRKLLHWYLQEYMWRDRFDRNNNAFDNIVRHIKLFKQFQLFSAILVGGCSLGPMTGLV